ncbi:hypothetical protein CCMA1212_005353 [Trichoderma ghanense]|uniref:Uncharacterized protein n=1 Tax=Trichoderma ghanense TaxID=65468 RepID=A0ABY2H3R0_9HYPO
MDDRFCPTYEGVGPPLDQRRSLVGVIVLVIILILVVVLVLIIVLTVFIGLDLIVGLVLVVDLNLVLILILAHVPLVILLVNLRNSVHGTLRIISCLQPTLLDN